MNILVVGAGYVGFEKLSAILKNSPKAAVKIVAERVSDDVLQMKKNYPQISVFQKAFEEKDLQGIQILILCINNKTLSAEIKAKARAYNILVNVADTPDLCDFYLSSIVQKGNLKIAVSTNGKSPTVAKKRREFQTILKDAESCFEL